MNQTIGRRLHESNPFYLVSAACMLVGCLAQSRAITLAGDDWAPLAWLIGVLQFYELLVIALSAYLIRRVGAVRDGTMLLVFECVFLVDATHLNAEMAASHPWVAPYAASLLLGLGAIKLVAMREILGFRSRRSLVTVLLQLAMLLYLPAAFSATEFMDSKVHALGLGREALPFVGLSFWWLVGAALALGRWVAEDHEHADGNAEPHPVARALSIAPIVALVLHLLALHWMYQLPLYASYLTPVLLGLSLRVFPFLFPYAKRALAWSMPVAALALSLGAAEALVGAFGPIEVAPFRLALLGVAVFFGLERHYLAERAFGWAALVALGAGISGSTPAAILERWTRIVPETPSELGFTGIVAAFAFLILGLAFSLWDSNPTSGDPPSGTPARTGPPRTASRSF